VTLSARKDGFALGRFFRSGFPEKRPKRRGGHPRYRYEERNISNWRDQRQRWNAAMKGRNEFLEQLRTKFHGKGEKKDNRIKYPKAGNHDRGARSFPPHLVRGREHPIGAEGVTGGEYVIPSMVHEGGHKGGFIGRGNNYGGGGMLAYKTVMGTV